MFKRKKLNFFVAMIMVMTLMFGSTICFATENNNEILQIYGLFAEKGYTREDVDEMFTKDELSDFIGATSISINNKYYKISPDDDVSEVSENVVIQNVENSIALQSSDVQKTADGYFQGTVVLADMGNDNYRISYTGRWLIEPENRNVDVAALFVDNISILQGTVKAYYSAQKNNRGALSVVTQNFLYDTTSKSIGGTFDLYEDDLMNGITYEKQYVYITVEGKMDLRATNIVSAWGEYYHQQKTIEVTPKITLSEISIDMTYKKYMRQMLNNPYTTELID